MQILPLSKNLTSKVSFIARESDSLNACLVHLGCSPLGMVVIKPWCHARYHDCHNNVLRYIDWYGGERIEGYYWLSTSGGFVAIRHSILHHSSGEFLDITPFSDERTLTLFSAIISPVHKETHDFKYGAHFII